MTNVLKSVKDFLKSKHMNVKHSWLEDCVKYIMSHEMSKDIQTIVQITAQQWLLSDLRIVSSGCLPQNLKSQSKVVLKEKYILQVDSEINIGASAYQQYCEIKNINDENVEATLSAEERIPSHRMLKISFTDGVQEICGIEYTKISIIKTCLVPGSKVLIKGPVVCRGGVLFLKNSSIEILGGEVKELSNNNVKTMILAKKLGLHVHPTSNNQQRDDSDKLVDNQDRHCSCEPVEKRQKIFSNDPSSKLNPNGCTNDVKIISSSPFIYIKQINDMNESAKMGKTCRVKAQILHLIKKPSYSLDSWTVECKITDGTGCLNVQIDSDWFSKLILYTPQEMAELNKKRFSNPEETPIIKKDLVKRLGKAMETLSSLYCIMELTLLSTPIIKKFIPFQKQHVTLLNERLQGF